MRTPTCCHPPRPTNRPRGPAGNVPPLARLDHATVPSTSARDEMPDVGVTRHNATGTAVVVVTLIGVRALDRAVRPAWVET